jgi:hypothetical protein
VVDLFAEDQAGLAPLASRLFDVVSYRGYRCDKYGKITVDGVHTYSVRPEAASRRVVAAFRARRVDVWSLEGGQLASHPWLFGKRRAVSTDQVAMMTALVGKPGAWRNSELRRAMADSPGQACLDSLDRAGLGERLKAIHTQAAAYGLSQTLDALDTLACRGRPFTVCDLAVVAARIDGFGLDREADSGPDLDAYDGWLGTASGAPGQPGTEGAGLRAAPANCPAWRAGCCGRLPPWTL